MKHPETTITQWVPPRILNWPKSPHHLGLIKRTQNSMYRWHPIFDTNMYNAAKVLFTYFEYFGRICLNLEFDLAVYLKRHFLDLESRLSLVLTKHLENSLHFTDSLLSNTESLWDWKISHQNISPQVSMYLDISI